MKNKIQLITYANSLGEDLHELNEILEVHLRPYIYGVHLLPFYLSGADGGFSPIDYTKVDRTVGTWEAIDRIGHEFELMIDFMPNHISAHSHWFRSFQRFGDRSKYAELFIDLDAMGLNDEALRLALEKVYRRKPRLPFITVDSENGQTHRLWCTFGEDQIDLNFTAPITKELMAAWLDELCSHPVKCLRLDALAYVVKKLGTDCFFVEPEIWEVLEWLRQQIGRHGIEILPEVHEHYSFQTKLAQKDFLVYDFALPVILLQAIFEKTTGYLIQWLNIRPTRSITTLDTHDGIGIADLKDLMPQEAIDATVAAIYKCGLDVNPEYSSHKYHNLDIYQINTTYFAALGGNADAYLVARAIQFFVPGIPQVYYVGLLAGLNDLDRVRETQEGRDINRHRYHQDEVISILENNPTVKRLLRLMKIRNEVEAFNGEFSIIPSNATDRIELRWQSADQSIALQVDLTRLTGEITHLSGERIIENFLI